MINISERRDLSSGFHVRLEEWSCAMGHHVGPVVPGPAGIPSE